MAGLSLPPKTQIKSSAFVPLQPSTHPARPNMSRKKVSDLLSLLSYMYMTGCVQVAITTTRRMRVSTRRESATWRTRTTRTRTTNKTRTKKLNFNDVSTSSHLWRGVYSSDVCITINIFKLTLFPQCLNIANSVQN